MVLGHKCSLATGRRWHRCRAGPEKPNPGASLAICCHSRPISSRASYPNCSAFLTLPKSDHVDPFSWEPGPRMEMPVRTASKASHVFEESQIASGQQKKEWDRGKERAQRESWWETETPGRQGWVGCGEGKEREKLPRCLKMVHAPAPAPMTLYIPSPLPPIRPLCSTLHLPISLKLAWTGLCYLQLTNPRLRPGGISRQGAQVSPRSPHKEWDRDTWPSGRTSHLYSAPLASITRRREGSPFSWPWGRCLVAYMTWARLTHQSVTGTLLGPETITRGF